MAKRTKFKIVEPEFVPAVKLRIGLGEEPGFTKVQSLDGYAPDSVDVIFSAFHFHRLDRAGRHGFMHNAWRVLKVGSQLQMIVPHHQSDRVYSDPLAEWPPVTAASFQWYDKGWREREQIDLGIDCHFAFGYGYGFNPNGYLAGRNEDFVQFAAAHEWNAVDDLHVTLTKLARP